MSTSPVTRLETAIERLEKLKTRDSTPGPWFVTYEQSRWPRVWGNQDENDADAVATTENGTGNAHLIITLHRTIDAQLDLLRIALAYGELPEGSGSRFHAAALALADAILGSAA